MAGPRIVAKVRSVPALHAIADRGVRFRVFSRLFWWPFYRTIRAAAPNVPAERARAMTAAMLGHTGGVETDAGAGLYNWNFGFITARGSDPQAFPQVDSHPVYDADGKYLRNDPHNALMRASASMLAGVSDYVTFIRDHASGAWGTLTHGDPADYLVTLRVVKYLGGHGESDGLLRGAMVSYMRAVDAATADLQPTPTKVAIGASLLAAAALTAGATIALHL